MGNSGVAAGGGSGLITGALGLAMACADAGLVNAAGGAAFTISAQQLSVYLCTPVKTANVTVLGTVVRTGGVTAGAGVNQLALYSEAGTLLAASADLTAAFGVSLSNAEGAITSTRLNAGSNYYLAVIANFTGTTLAVEGTSGSFNLPSVNGHFISRFLTAQASVPATITPSTMSASGGVPFLYAR